ncbi:hypothetical protein llap_8577 [Limosa lapponica baueri]|uniref:RNA-directed DNA polymerase from mobile element jockey n=1 Tax=Limosa lapponica baueri TaxID=1758121 RepID=A0A2I0U4Y3_LIMLA|nr:hypothetical protein llap_8577 [Limosa lapponica baueri]
MGNKQEELEATVLLESYDTVAIAETWWDESHNQSVAIKGYKLFRRDRRGRKGGAVALYVKEWIETPRIHSHPGVAQMLLAINSRTALLHSGTFTSTASCLRYLDFKDVSHSISKLQEAKILP